MAAQRLHAWHCSTHECTSERVGNLVGCAGSRIGASTAPVLGSTGGGPPGCAPCRIIQNNPELTLLCSHSSRPR